MRKRMTWLCWLATVLFSTTGCEVLLIGAAALGTGTGTYYYVNGELRADHNAPFDRVWTATEKTIADMHATDVQPYREIAKGHIYAVVNENNIKVSLAYKTKTLTTVAVRVGLFGDKTAAQRLHDKIAEHLSKR